MRIEAADELVCRTLEGLLSVCRQGKDRFLFAADNTTDRRLKSLFTQYAQERARFAADLEDEVRRHGGEVKPASLGAPLTPAWWKSPNTATERHRVDSLLSECERGEDRALGEYYRALTLNLPEECYHLLERQFDAFKQAYDRIYALD